MRVVADRFPRQILPFRIEKLWADDHAVSGRGIGAGLLKDAMPRTLQAADIAGIRALAVHAKDDNARRFCAHFGFIPSPTDALHLHLLLKDIKRHAGNSP